MTSGWPGATSCRRSTSRSAPCGPTTPPTSSCQSSTRVSSPQQDFAINSLNHPDPYNDFLTQFAAEQPIFVPKAWVGLDMSKREHEAGSIELARKREEIAFKVCQAWLMVHTARAQLTVAREGGRGCAGALPDREAALRGRPRHVRRHPAGKHRPCRVEAAQGHGGQAAQPRTAHAGPSPRPFRLGRCGRRDPRLPAQGYRGIRQIFPDPRRRPLHGASLRERREEHPHVGNGLSALCRSRRGIPVERPRESLRQLR